MKRRHFLKAISLSPFVASALRAESLLNQTFAPSAVAPGAISASMWTYLWDLVDEGYDQVLGRLRDCGLTSISLASAYHAGKFLAPHNPKRKVIFPEDGTIYFKPDLKRYDFIQPIVNTLVDHGHGLRRTIEEAGRKGLKTHAWVVCCHNTPLGMRHPDVVCENAFGDKLFHNLCPSNDHVRRYLQALIGDIASLDVDTIELEALQFQGYSHGFHHEREGLELNAVSRFLLGLCFCPSCLAKAKSQEVDLPALRRYTISSLESWFSDPVSWPATMDGLDRLPKDILDPFLAWRRNVVTSLLESIVDAAGRITLRHLMHVDPLPRMLVSVDAAASARLTGGILALGYIREGEKLRESMRSLKTILSDAEIRVGLQVGMPESGGKAEFMTRMKVLKDLGIRSFNFYNYGFIPYENFEWIKESLAS